MRLSILDTAVDVQTYHGAAELITSPAYLTGSRRVHAANVHMIMEGHDDPAFQQVIDTADLVVPDGVPLVWALKMQGQAGASRVYGPTLTLHVCAAAEKKGLSIGLYGGTPESLDAFQAFLHQRFPALEIACAISPPFRALSPEEDLAYTRQIKSSGAKILFVGIGCPKQEWWMYRHRDQLPLVMLGVGAAFDFHSGKVKQAPPFLQRLGLEWLFRLAMEPRRLWKRYAKHNPRFAYLLVRQLLRTRFQNATKEVKK